MKIKTPLILASCILVTTSAVFSQDGPEPDWQASIVTLETSRVITSISASRGISGRKPQPKLGTVIERNEILTTAQGLANRTLVRLQKGGRGKWYNGSVEWVDYQAKPRRRRRQRPSVLGGVGAGAFRPRQTNSRETCRSCVGAAGTSSGERRSSAASPWRTPISTKRHASR